YILLVIFVLAWGELQPRLNRTNLAIPWPLLHNTISRVSPAVSKPAPYPAVFTFGWLSASGTACLIAAVLSAIFVRLTPRQFAKVIGDTARQLAKAELTLAAVLALAFLMNYWAGL
ncbi:MAG TPA: L-lactate permease, partial [Candidatus Binataceae bacterium]